MSAIAKTLRDNLTAIASAYARATGTTLEQVSKRYYGNQGFFREFKRGERSVSIDKLQEMVEAFAKAWPDDAEWPYLPALVIHRPARRRKSVPKKSIRPRANQLSPAHEAEPA